MARPTWLMGLVAGLVAGTALGEPVSAELCQAARLLFEDARELAASNVGLAALDGVACEPATIDSGKLSVLVRTGVDSCQVLESQVTCDRDFVREIASGDAGVPSAALLFVVAHELGHIAAGERDTSAFDSSLLLEGGLSEEPCGAISVLVKTYPEALERERQADAFALRLLRQALSRTPYVNLAAPSAGLWSHGADIRQAFVKDHHRAETDTWPIPSDVIRYDAEDRVCTIAAGGALESFQPLPGDHPDWVSRAALIASLLAPSPQADAPSVSPWDQPQQRALSDFTEIDQFMLGAEAEYFVELREAFLDAGDRCLKGALKCPPATVRVDAADSSEGCQPLEVEWTVESLDLTFSAKAPTEGPAVGGPIAALTGSVFAAEGDRLWLIRGDAVSVARLPCAPTALAASDYRVLIQCPQWEGLLHIDLEGTSRRLVPEPRRGKEPFQLKAVGVHTIKSLLVASYMTEGPTYMLEVPPRGAPYSFPREPAITCDAIQQAGAAFPWLAEDQSLFLTTVGDATVQVCTESEVGYGCADPYEPVLDRYLEEGLENDLAMPGPFLGCGPGPDGMPYCIDDALSLVRLGDAGATFSVEIPGKSEESDLQVSRWCRTRDSAWLLVRDETRSLVLRMAPDGLRLAGAYGPKATLACDAHGAVLRDGRGFEALP